MRNPTGSRRVIDSWYETFEGGRRYTRFFKKHVRRIERRTIEDDNRRQLEEYFDDVDDEMKELEAICAEAEQWHQEWEDSYWRAVDEEMWAAEARNDRREYLGDWYKD